MLEILFVTVLALGGLFGAFCIVEHSAKLRRIENDRFIKQYKKIHLEAERERSAKEMAGMIMVIERECKRNKR
jgi:hypothetical protein